MWDLRGVALLVVRHQCTRGFCVRFLHCGRYAMKKAAEALGSKTFDVDQGIKWLFSHPATEGEVERWALRSHPRFKFLNRFRTGGPYKQAVHSKSRGAGECSVCDPWYHAPHFLNLCVPGPVRRSVPLSKPRQTRAPEN